MYRKLRFVLSILAELGLGAATFAQQRPVEPMEKTPVFRSTVVSRTTKAVDYRHRGGSTKVDLAGTDLMLTVKGEATVESKTGRLEINVKLEGLHPASKFGLEYLTYVLWAITPEGRANNLGEIILNDEKSELHATTELQAFGLIVTAEPYFAVTQPSDLVVAENIVRQDTKGRVEAIDVKYELLPRGLYTSQLEPIRDAVYGIDSKAPLELFEARNAVRVARAAKAEEYAATSFAKAEQLLKQAEDYYARKQGRTPIGTVAREAAQTAEEARVMSLKRQEEERIEKEREAGAAREAQANAQANEEARRREQAEAERGAAERAQADAERSKQEAETGKAAALALQQEAERGRQQAETEKAELRAKLLQQLNTILVTRDTVRGLIATMPDVLFETNKFALRSEARERLAKIAGILLAYPDLRLEVDGHTDSVGSDEYNQQLSEKRAASVRDYLVQQDIPISSIAIMGFGKTQPVASNASAAGRQKNRRVELVVSGEVIGTKIGGTPN